MGFTSRYNQACNATKMTFVAAVPRLLFAKTYAPHTCARYLSAAAAISCAV